MALQMILGNSGAGKSHYIFEKVIRESMENPGKQFLVIVPEQFTMQTQKDLVRMHPCHGIMNIDVLSFERLAHRVFEEVGGEHRKILEDTGKNLILRRLAQEKQEELTILGGNLRKPGYISEVKSLISEFTQYQIQPRQLEEMIRQNQDNPQLYYKLKDMKVLFDSFREYLAEDFLTAEELLGALEKVVEQSKTVQGSVIVLDGYTGFTPVQLGLMKRLLTLADEVYVTLTMDSRENPFVLDAEYQLFHMTKQTIHSLIRIAEEVRVEVRRPMIFGDAGACRFQKAPALAFLETQIFRHGNRFWEGDTEEIQIYAAGTPREEAEAIGRMVQRLARDKGLRYRDMAVVTGDLESYGPLLEQVFLRLHIPGFIDRKMDVLKNPFVEWLRALLGAVQEDFSYESMFRFLRSGMTQLTPEETDLLENYVIARGIRGFSGWNRKWDRSTARMRREWGIRPGMAEEEKKALEEAELETLNGLRKKAIDGIEALRGELKKKGQTSEGMTHALYEYMIRCRMQERLKSWEDHFEEKGDFVRSRECAGIYGMVMDLFDKIVLLLQDTVMSLEEYIQILDAGLAEMKMGMIPAGTDQIVVGDMERSRLKDIQVLFFAGVNEGSVPKDKHKGGILSEIEREILLEQQVELAPTLRQETYIQKFYIYLNLTKPSKRLYLSYSLTDTGGSPLRPSFLISQVQQLYPELNIGAAGEEELTKRLATPQGSAGELIRALKAVREKKANREDLALIRWFGRRGSDGWEEKLTALMDQVCYTRKEDPVGRAVARRLYGTLLEGSVTRLEQFAACAYAHFLQYGLCLGPRETYGLEPVDMGNVFHDALKIFSDLVNAGEYDWFHVPDQQRNDWMQQALEQALEACALKDEDGSAKDQYTLERMKRIGQRTAWAILEQLKRGAFFPEQTEVSFRNLEQLPSVSVLLSEDERMRLQGRIDRIDVCRRDGNTYVRVIDYKSGSTRFDLTSIYYGLQLQLVVYLSAAMELERRRTEGEIHPAGMFYYHIEDPMLEYEEEGDVQERLLKELALNGLVNADPKIVHLQDKMMEKRSDILPVSLKTNGEYTAYSSVAAEEEFARLAKHVQKKLAEYGKRILQGEIALSPYEMGSQDACSYCDYHSVCGFDRKLPGCSKRRLVPMEKEEIWKKLREEDEE